MKLAWSNRATTDRLAIFIWIAEDNPQAAADVDDRIVAEVAAIADHRWPQAASGDRLLPGESGAVTCKGKQRGLALEMVAIDLFESHAMADLLLTTRQAVLCYASCAYAVSLFSGAQGDRK